MLYDIAIIGAGPSGGMIAKLLRNDYSIIVIERNRKKCCAGILVPKAYNLLKEHGMEIPEEVIDNLQPKFRKSINIDKHKEWIERKYYLNTNRDLFNQWLINIISDKKNIMLKQNTQYISHKYIDGKNEILVSEGNEIKKIESKVIIGADGAYSRVRENIKNDFAFRSKYLSIQGIYETENDLDHYLLIFNQNITDYYSWVVPKKGKLLIGSAFLKANTAMTHFNYLINEIRRLGYRFSTTSTINMDFMIRPVLKQVYFGDEHTALIGEAAGFVSATTGEGIGNGFYNAVVLSDCINASLTNWYHTFKKGENRLLFEISKSILKAKVKYSNKLNK
jgi:geranylgeranyl diphosphate/geranylgeranyl-bacteriochlorophyllide a reductase